MSSIDGSRRGITADRERRDRGLEALALAGDPHGRQVQLSRRTGGSVLPRRGDPSVHAGLRLERRGVVRRSQWTIIADWAAVGAGDEVRATGTNVFTFDADRKIESVVGFWN
jgi:hypothetical protein